MLWNSNVKRKLLFILWYDINHTILRLREKSWYCDLFVLYKHIYEICKVQVNNSLKKKTTSRIRKENRNKIITRRMYIKKTK